MIVVLMGVSGSGKTTIGTLLAEQTDVVFADADDYHPAANKAKMAAGHPLNDEDRQPWLEASEQLDAGLASRGPRWCARVLRPEGELPLDSCGWPA